MAVGPSIEGLTARSITYHPVSSHNSWQTPITPITPHDNPREPPRMNQFAGTSSSKTTSSSRERGWFHLSLHRTVVSIVTLSA